MLLNGEPVGFFPLSRGLRQGNPLFPSLFIIASEVLSRSFNDLHVSTPSVRFSTLSGCPIISHLAFADGVIIFCNGNRRSLERHKALLAAYEGCSGQLVNGLKSNFYVSPTLPVDRAQSISSSLGYSEGHLPITYLGCPLYYGRKKKQYFHCLFLKLQQRIGTWLGSLLNPTGRVTLITHRFTLSLLISLLLLIPLLLWFKW